jgi:tetratricopeptide (TPR) repeat protein
MVDDPVLLLKQLPATLATRNREAINSLVRNIIQTEALLGAKWKSIAAISQANAELKDAIAAMDLYVSQSNSTAMARFEKAAVLAQMGRVREANDLMTLLPDSIPDSVSNNYIRGTLATNLGHFQTAREHFRNALAANPLSGQTWLALGMLGHLEDLDSKNLIAIADRMQHSAAGERAPYLYALGKHFAEQKRYDDSYAAFAEGAELRRTAENYQLDEDRISAKRAKAGWSISDIERISQSLTTTEYVSPIFVTGLPRSGTTLVEQILSSHSMVSDGGELGFFRLLHQEIGGDDKAAFDRYTLNGGNTDKLVQLYHHILTERYTGGGRVIDKSLDSSRHIPLIAGLFPQSPIVWVRRDAKDCAWSAFRTWFLRGQNWSWNFKDIAEHMKIEDDLFQYWMEMLGDRILVVEYANLVAEPTKTIPIIVAHCGLKLESPQLRPHETDRVVSTASVSQVRQPINSNAIGASIPYHKFMGEFS